jgi:hypothetical protein
MFPPWARFFAAVINEPQQASRRAKPGPGGRSQRAAAVLKSKSRFRRTVLLGAAVFFAVSSTASAATIRGTKRADRIQAVNGVRDGVSCGNGSDVVTADPADRVAADCEVVSRRVSNDPYRNSDSQHQTEVEPDNAAAGSTVVDVFQVGRIFGGGAANIGFATSLDAGRTWRRGFLPGLTVNSTPRGDFPIVSDPSVAYDALHGTWLVASLAVAGDRSALLVSRSADGLRWSAPVVATLAPTLGPLLLDKEWIVCDNGATSRFRGHCYLSYSDFRTLAISTQVSVDGGASWGAPVTPPDAAGRRSIEGAFAPGVQPVVEPDGTVLDPFFDQDRLALVRSTDGGVTWSSSIAVGPARPAVSGRLRAGPLPVADVGSDGTAYVVWTDCGLRPSCGGNDVVVSVSRDDGLTWSAPTAIPTGPRTVDYVIPGFAVDPANPRRLALVYYTRSGEVLDVFLVTSSDGGATWARPRRLNARSFPLGWIARTAGGSMVGDYMSTAFSAGRIVPVFVLALRPRGTTLQEAAYSASLAR